MGRNRRLLQSMHRPIAKVEKGLSGSEVVVANGTEARARMH